MVSKSGGSVTSACTDDSSRGGGGSAKSEVGGARSYHSGRSNQSGRSGRSGGSRASSRASSAGGSSRGSSRGVSSARSAGRSAGSAGSGGGSAGSRRRRRRGGGSRAELLDDILGSASGGGALGGGMGRGSSSSGDLLGLAGGGVDGSGHDDVEDGWDFEEVSLVSRPVSRVSSTSDLTTMTAPARGLGGRGDLSSLPPTRRRRQQGRQPPPWRGRRWGEIEWRRPFRLPRRFRALDQSRQTYRRAYNSCIVATLFVLLVGPITFGGHGVATRRQPPGFNFKLHPANTVNSYVKSDEELRQFQLCGRYTPLTYRIDPHVPPARQRPILEPIGWPTANRLLLLRNDGHFGHIGNQVNSLLHAYDYAMDHQMELGILFHSWAMDTIQTIAYETDTYDRLGRDLYEDLNIIVIRNQTQLQGYTEVHSESAKKLYFYSSSNYTNDRDMWTKKMPTHVSVLRRLFLRHNRGYGYVHNGLRAEDTCSSVHQYFKSKSGQMRYTVIHSEYQGGKIKPKLELLSKKTMITVEQGAMYMHPFYIRSILKPVDMLERPIILISDGQFPAVERNLLADPVIGPRLMILSNRESLGGSDVNLAVGADVFIGNPASVTSGLIARARHSLGIDYRYTYLFRRKVKKRWMTVCTDECFWNPWVLGVWV